MSKGVAFVEEFVLNLDAVLRVGGVIINEESEDSERIHAALLSAREKYRVHFEGEEAAIIL